ncbi:MAG: UDP-glucose/GDP-mannose dehydrogenase family protein [Chloroflexota bacterium]
MRVAVLGGAGYVGLVTGVGLAALGHTVVCADVNSDKFAMLSGGRSPIVEEGMKELLARQLAAGRLTFTTDAASAITGAAVVFIAVGTPPAHDGQSDLSQVVTVALSIAQHLSPYAVVVLKSTVPVGTVDLVREILSERAREGEDFDIAANPEFLREGKGLADFFKPDRIVIGAAAERPLAVLRELYAPLLAGKAPGQSGPATLVETSIPTAQMIKYAANAYLATRISFINELALVCERTGVDVEELTHGLGLDPRIGASYLHPGLGFGGPCLEKDLRALVHVAESHGFQPGLLRAVLERNEGQLEEVASRLRTGLGGLLFNRVIGALGLAFKAGTNDVRDSMAMRLVDRLEREGATVRAHDPEALDAARAVLPGLACVDDPYDVAEGAHALVVLTEWPQYKALDLVRLRARMAGGLLVDTRNLLDPAHVRAAGFTYVGIGRAA